MKEQSIKITYLDSNNCNKIYLKKYNLLILKNIKIKWPKIGHFTFYNDDKLHLY